MIIAATLNLRDVLERFKLNRSSNSKFKIRVKATDSCSVMLDSLTP